MSQWNCPIYVYSYLDYYNTHICMCICSSNLKESFSLKSIHIDAYLIPKRNISYSSQMPIFLWFTLNLIKFVTMKLYKIVITLDEPLKIRMIK